MNVSVNMEYLIKSIEERIEKDLIFRELHSLINEYCIEVTGMYKEHILFDDIERMFYNKEIVNITIEYGLSCLEGITEKEKAYIIKIVSTLKQLQVYYDNCVPF